MNRIPLIVAAVSLLGAAPAPASFGWDQSLSFSSGNGDAWTLIAGAIALGLLLFGSGVAGARSGVKKIGGGRKA